MWNPMALTRDELKAKRLQAQAVVGNQMQATADMYDRVITAGSLVAAARDLAEQAHLADLNAQIADLKEMAEDLAGFSQAVPTTGAAPAPATASVKPSQFVSDALAVLNATQPHPRADAWAKGDAYVGTRLEPATPQT
jgi:hypothetical protein